MVGVTKGQRGVMLGGLIKRRKAVGIGEVHNKGSGERKAKKISRPNLILILL